MMAPKRNEFHFTFMVYRSLSDVGANAEVEPESSAL